jgi:hypothetical protein
MCNKSDPKVNQRIEKFVADYYRAYDVPPTIRDASEWLDIPQDYIRARVHSDTFKDIIPFENITFSKSVHNMLVLKEKNENGRNMES